MEGTVAIMTMGHRFTRRVVRESGSTFAWSFRFLSKPQRRGMLALYAFCRIADDIVDESWETAIKEKQLVFWRGQVLQAVANESRHPMTIELGFLMREFGVTTDELLTLLDGVAADCYSVVPQTRNDLECYCYGVASIVGIMCLRIFGVGLTDTTREAAVQLGYAFQCTNILRDITVDAENGRCYLPRDELAAAQLSSEIFLEPRDRDRIRDFLSQQCERTWAYFKKAWSLFPEQDHSKLFPARVMSVYYEALLRKMTRDPLTILSGPVSLSFFHKVGLLVQAGFSRP